MQENLGNAEVLHQLHLVQHRELPHSEPAVTPKWQHQVKATFRRRSPMEEGMWGMCGARVVVSCLGNHLGEDEAVGHHPPPCPALSRLPPLYHLFPHCLQMQCGTTHLDLTWQDIPRGKMMPKQPQPLQIWLHSRCDPHSCITYQILHITLTSLIRNQQLLQLLPLAGTRTLWQFDSH